MTREKDILNMINLHGSASVNHLSEQFNVSVETIRRDLKTLESSGLILRTHGGAVSHKSNDIGSSFNARQRNNIEPKQLMAERILPHIFEGAVIGLDASSTSWHFAKSMPNIKCTVVTNSINIVNALAEKENISVIGTGGAYSHKYAAFHGPLAEKTLDNLSLDFCVISCVGIDIDKGVWESNELNASIKRKMINSSDQKILMADESKFNKKSLIKLCDIDDIDILVSNININDDDTNKLEKHNTLLLMCNF